MTAVHSTGGRRVVVVSAVNFSEGGPLTVLLECLACAADVLGPEWEIVALVHDAALVSHPMVRTIAFPESKRSWAKRLRLEWGGGFLDISRDLRPDLWLSLHDITPRVMARRQIVYCHNPSPFHPLAWREARLDPGFALFNMFYAHLYRMFIWRNQAVVVQQEWLRREFRRLYAHPNIIVAHPEGLVRSTASSVCPSAHVRERYVLLYPALPRVFKNIETLCEAVALLPSAVSSRLTLKLTLDGSENRYAREILQRYKNVAGLSFIGRQQRDAMVAHYACCDAVVFPSRLETWGLPISEAKALGKPLLVADLPYARETVGSYDAVTFLPPQDASAWAAAMEELVDGRWRPQGHRAEVIPGPHARGWAELWTMMVEGL